MKTVWTPAILCLVFVARAQTGSPNVVVSQIYGGGGNKGATLKNDFIELFNRGSAPVNLNGWTVQHAAATGSVWDRTLLSGTIQPGRYYLIAEEQGSAGTVSLPTPDAAGGIAISATSDKIALVSNAINLSGASPSGSGIVDFVGYGASNAAEGQPASGLDNVTALVRKSGGCTDTNNNRDDFTTGSPNPRNSGSPGNPCAAVFLPAISPNGVVNAASFQPGIEAGSWVTILGSNLANTSPGRTWRSDEIVNGNLPTSLDGVSVTIDGRPAYIYYISPNLINVQAPSDSTQGPVAVVVNNNGLVSSSATAQLQTFAPAFFQISGTNYAVTSRFPDYALIANPKSIPGAVAAKPGDVVILWGTGFGPTFPETAAGKQVTGAPAATTAPIITIGGVPAGVLGVVLSPGSVGLYQIAIQLPNSLVAGDVQVLASVSAGLNPRLT